MLALNGVAVTYANGTQALKTTTLTFNQGQFVVLLGRSGAGKSTSSGHSTAWLRRRLVRSLLTILVLWMRKLSFAFTEGELG